jgi:hypothetical protein
MSKKPPILISFWSAFFTAKVFARVGKPQGFEDL